MATLQDHLISVVGSHEVDGVETPINGSDVVSTQVRQTVTQILRALDPDAYVEYRKRKYAKGENPTLAQRKAAYRFAFGKFLDATYTIPGF